jgi:hypothetical protein
LFYLIISQAFEQVIPNERTKISLSIIDGSILVLAPNHPGGMLIGINELNFEIDVISETKALEFHLTAPGLAILMLDDRGSPSKEPITKPSQSMLSHWEVSGPLFSARPSTEEGPSNSDMLSSSESRIWIFYSIRIMKYNRKRLSLRFITPPLKCTFAPTPYRPWELLEGTSRWPSNPPNKSKLLSGRTQPN